MLFAVAKVSSAKGRFSFVGLQNFKEVPNGNLYL